ncbi:MAG: hypothetical protein LBQ58_01370 [Synergistaceae bacterium]|jgi:hypothetical protein|nr:hypothetical protein [Synergistaceae bacterium]
MLTDIALFIQAINKDLTSFLWQSSEKMSECLLKSIFIVNLLFFLRGLLFTMQLDVYEYFYIVSSLVLCVFTTCFYFVYYKFIETRKAIIMQGISFMLVSFFSIFLAKIKLIIIIMVVYLVVFVFSLKRGRVDVNVAKRWNSFGILVAVILYVIIGIFMQYPNTGINYSGMRIAFMFFIIILVRFLLQTKRKNQNGLRENKIVLYIMSIITAFVNIAAMPIFFAWFPLPGFNPAGPFAMTLEYICMIAITPLYLELTRDL